MPKLPSEPCNGQESAPSASNAKSCAGDRKLGRPSAPMHFPLDQWVPPDPFGPYPAALSLSRIAIQLKSSETLLSTVQRDRFNSFPLSSQLGIQQSRWQAKTVCTEKDVPEPLIEKQGEPSSADLSRRTKFLIGLLQRSGTKLLTLGPDMGTRVENDGEKDRG